MTDLLHGLFGIIGIFIIAYLLCNNKRHINFRTVGLAFTLQVLFALFVLYIPIGKTILQGMSSGLMSALDAGNVGLKFVFGPLAESQPGFIFAVSVLGTIVFFSSLISVLYFIKVMPFIINTIGLGLHKALQTSRAESLSATANIFVGQTEAPLVVKPFLPHMTNSEIFAIMIGGLCSISGGVLAGYVNLGINAHYLITSAFMSAPAGLLMAKLVVPEVDTPIQTLNELDALNEVVDKPTNVVEAAANGAATGLHLALNVGAMLIAFIGLMTLLDYILGGLGHLIHVNNLSISLILGYIFSPIAYLTGVSWHESMIFGSLLGTKIVVNEFVAYADFLKVAPQLSEKAKTIITFALCGFSNISSIGILIGGLGIMAPAKKPAIAKLAVKAIIVANLTDLLSATIAGMITSL